MHTCMYVFVSVFVCIYWDEGGIYRVFGSSVLFDGLRQWFHVCILNAWWIKFMLQPGQQWKVTDILTIQCTLCINSTFIQQLWTVVPSQTPPMAKLVTLLEQHLDRLPPTVVIPATTWWETVLAHVKLQEGGLERNLHVRVGCYWVLCNN